jgi:hypothetical protein
MTQLQFEQLFESNKELLWDYEFLSNSNYITWNMIRNNLNKPWNLKKISRNKIITIEHVLDSPFLRWDWDELTLNENMTFDVIIKHIRKPWSTDLLEQKLTLEQLDEFYSIREDNNSIISDNSYDSYDSYDSKIFMYEI